jgi:hypothetical protein
MTFGVVLSHGLGIRPMILVRIWSDLGTEISDPIAPMLLEYGVSSLSSN